MEKNAIDYRAYDLHIASLSTIVISISSVLTGARFGFKAGFLCFGACLLASSLWVFLMGMLFVILDRAFLRSERKIFRTVLGLLVLLKNFGLVLGPMFLALLLFR